MCWFETAIGKPQANVPEEVLKEKLEGRAEASKRSKSRTENGLSQSNGHRAGTRCRVIIEYRCDHVVR